MSAQFPILWLTGNTGAGKSTLGFAVRDYFNQEMSSDHPLARRVVLLDGDEMRETISTDEDLSPEGRRRHNLRVSRLAKLLQNHGHLVIVTVIAPFEEVRSEVSAICNPQWIYIERSGLGAEDKPYEPPSNPALVINNDELSVEEAREKLITYMKNISARN